MEPLTPENYAFLQTQVYNDSGIVLDDTKHYLIESRLGPLLQQERLRTLNDLCAILRATTAAPLRRQVVEAMTTNETLFFRDPNVFDALRNTLLPELSAQRAATRMLSLWSAASSTGQEAYSLAMLLLEMGLGDWTIGILGTDLNRQVIERARAGLYQQIEVNRGLPAKYLVKYFKKSGGGWQIADTVRRMVVFRHFDLRDSLEGIGPFDLVLCRNVLIYFDVETRRRILRRIRARIAPGGHLLLGCAESTIDLDDSLTRRVIDKTVFYRIP
jgi:chemotaxis protein methyltransferase CheR